MHVVAVLSLKGGVGKTTVVLGLAGAAAQRGLRTLVIDLDPQANATVTLDPEPTTASVADVLDEPQPSMLRRAIARSAWGKSLDVLVGSEDTERHNHPDPSAKRLIRLARALSRLDRVFADGGCERDRDDEPGGTDQLDAGQIDSGKLDSGEIDPDQFDTGQFDYFDTPDPAGTDIEPYQLILVDCPPSLGQLTRSALTAANRAVLVTDPTMFSVAGVQRAFEAVQHERERGNPALQPLGVLVNRVRPRSGEHAFRIAELRELFGPLVFTTVVPDRSAIQQAQGACLPIQEWDTPGAREVSAVFNTLLGRALRSSLRNPEQVPYARPGTHS